MINVEYVNYSLPTQTINNDWTILLTLFTDAILMRKKGKAEKRFDYFNYK